MVNKSRCKRFCYNLCCLIQSDYELGIVAKFWRTDGATETAPAVETEDEAGEAWGWV